MMLCRHAARCRSAFDLLRLMLPPSVAYTPRFSLPLFRLLADCRLLLHPCHVAADVC